MEIWKDVKGYEGKYQISNLGNVKSLTRKVKHPKGGLMILNGRILKLQKDSKGYLFANLCIDNVAKIVYVHHMVAESFLYYIKGPRNVVVDHIDSCKTNNRLENLQVISQRENVGKGKAVIGESKYQGVSMCSKKKYWTAITRYNGKQIVIGRYKTEEEARDAYIAFYADK